MPRLHPLPKAREIMRRYLCETCGVAPEQPCLTPKGAETPEHAARYRAARADGALPLPEGKTA